MSLLFLLLLLLLAPLPDIVEVEVGTEAEQHDGRQHEVDQVPEFRLQVALPVPDDLQGGMGRRYE